MFKGRIAVGTIGLALLVAGCSAGNQAAAPVTTVAMSPAAAVQAAVSLTSAAGSAVLHLTMAVNAAGKTIGMDFGGPMKLDGSAADISGKISGAALGAGGDLTIHEIIIGKVVYLKLNMPGAPDTWFKMDLSTMIPGLSALQGLSGSAGAGEQLQQLRSLANVKSVGTETVNGVRTTHYTGQVDLSKVTNLLSKLGSGLNFTKITGGAPIPINVWVSDGGLVVKLVENISVKLSGQTASVKVGMDLSDFGVKVAPAAPSGAADLASLLGGLAPTA